MSPSKLKCTSVIAGWRPYFSSQSCFFFFLLPLYGFLYGPFYGKGHLYTSIPLYLAVNCSPLNCPATYQNKSADLNHNSACPASRGPCSGGPPPVSVPLVNNRKGSLLPPAVPSALRLSTMGTGAPVIPPRRRPAAAVAAAAGEASRIQRARSLPVKYRYHSGHPSNATLSHKHRKPPPPPTVFGLVAVGRNNDAIRSMCLPGHTCMCSIPY